MKFVSKDLIEINSQNQQDSSLEKKDVDKKLFKSENPSLKQNENENEKENEKEKENNIPIEENKVIKSALGKLFNKYHERKANEMQENKFKTSILKTIQMKELTKKQPKDVESKFLMTKIQIQRNFKVKNTVIEKDWLKGKENLYDVILLNAFYLVDIKKNLQNTKAKYN